MNKNRSISTNSETSVGKSKEQQKENSEQMYIAQKAFPRKLKKIKEEMREASVKFQPTFFIFLFTEVLESDMIGILYVVAEKK